LGITAMNIPEDFDGIAAHRSTVTNALVAEALAYGDMGLALPILAPGGVASALTHWGSADQQATYLREFAAENVPQACLAIAEPHALFDPTALKTTAVRTPSGSQHGHPRCGARQGRSRQRVGATERPPR
jgi:alkylation response protein AidB-like acyl-CoA dehydrogenase